MNDKFKKNVLIVVIVISAFLLLSPDDLIPILHIDDLMYIVAIAEGIKKYRKLKRNEYNKYDSNYYETRNGYYRDDFEDVPY